MMILSGVTKGFGDGAKRLEVLKDIHLEVREKETVALLGKSGSGKSTLLSLMAGLDRPDQGTIVIGSQDITQLAEKDLANFRASSMGIVFQQFHLVSTLTALENVLLPLELLRREGAMRIASELLANVGLKDRFHHLPSELSGGESQRVAVARALAIGPKILFADEPSGNLDEETGETVMNLLFRMVKDSGSTMVLVTHDPDLAKHCDRTIHLEHGRIQ